MSGLTLRDLSTIESTVDITATDAAMVALRNKDTKTEWFYIKFYYNNNHLELVTICQDPRERDVVWAFKSFCRMVASFFSIFGFDVTSRSALINQVKQLSKDENVKKSTVDKDMLNNLHTSQIKYILHRMVLRSNVSKLSAEIGRTKEGEDAATKSMKVGEIGELQNNLISLRNEKTEAESELSEIENELNKLNS